MTQVDQIASVTEQPQSDSSATVTLKPQRGNTVTLLDENTVQIEFSFKMQQGAKKVHFKKVLLDFTGVTREQLVKQCCSAQSLVVKMQSQLRDLDEKVATHEKTLSNIVVRDYISGKSATVSDEMAIRTLSIKSGRSEDEIRAFLHSNPELLQSDNSDTE